jgi:hypothetical protein
MRGKTLVVLALAAVLCSLAALPAQSAATCFKRAPSLVAVPGVPTYGTPGPDVILGTNGNDVIYGRGGNDRLCGLGGNDKLYGEAGRDRISGGAGNDDLRGGPGKHQVLRGDDGADEIYSLGLGTVASGGDGSDLIRTNDPFVVIRGNGGADLITAGYRNDLNAGLGVDSCTLGLGTPGTGCETVTLDCGTGGTPLPSPLPAGWTMDIADFDGNGWSDTLYVWNDGAHWIASVQTDGGFGAQLELPTHPSDSAEALGGHDINGDGIDEAFIKVGSGASTSVVGLYALFQPDPDELPLYTCGLEPVLFTPSMAEASFVIGGSVMHGDGLQCRAHNTLRQYQQETLDGTHWTQDRDNFRYLPQFAVARPVLPWLSHTQHNLVWPADQAQINLGYALNCSGVLAP